MSRFGKVLATGGAGATSSWVTFDPMIEWQAERRGVPAEPTGRRERVEAA